VKTVIINVLMMLSGILNVYVGSPVPDEIAVACLGLVNVLLRAFRPSIGVTIKSQGDKK